MGNSSVSRETALAQTLVEVAESLVNGFDVIEMLATLSERYVDLFEVTTAGFMLADPEEGELRLMASSSETMRIVELYELQSQEGPCVDCYHTNEPLLNQNLSTAEQWKNFAPVAIEAGFRAVHALPIRLRGVVMGAVNIFCDSEAILYYNEILPAQALADMAAIAIVQNRSSMEAQELNEQLSRALESRIVIEQAKGMLAESGWLDMNDAFSKLRSYARNNNLQLTQVARDLIDRQIDLSTLEKDDHAFSN